MARRVWRTPGQNRVLSLRAPGQLSWTHRGPVVPNLAPLFSMLENAKADELRLIPGEAPCVITDGNRRNVTSQPMNARLIMAAAADLLSKEELADLPSQRPRIVRK